MRGGDGGSSSDGGGGGGSGGGGGDAGGGGVSGNDVERNKLRRMRQSDVLCEKYREFLNKH